MSYRLLSTAQAMLAGSRTLGMPAALAGTWNTRATSSCQRVGRAVPPWPHEMQPLVEMSVDWDRTVVVLAARHGLPGFKVPTLPTHAGQRCVVDAAGAGARWTAKYK